MLKRLLKSYKISKLTQKAVAQVGCQKGNKDHGKNVKNAVQKVQDTTITNNQDPSKDKENELLFDQQKLPKKQKDNDEKKADEENINQLEPTQPKPNNSTEKRVNDDIDQQKVHDGKANDINEGWIKPNQRTKKQKRENVNHEEQPKNESNQEKQQSNNDGKIKHIFSTTDNQNSQKQIPDLNPVNDSIPVPVSTNLEIQRKETWSEVAAKLMKQQNNDESKIKHNSSIFDNQNSQDMDSNNVGVSASVSTNLKIQCKETWSEVAAKLKKQQSNDESKIKHNLSTFDDQNSQKQIPDLNTIPAVPASTNLGIQCKKTWSEVAAKPKKKYEPKIQFFCLPDADSANISTVLLKTAGTTFQQNITDALRMLLAGGELILVLSEIGIAQSDNTYTTDIPLIEEHKEILPSIWEKIRDQHIVTGGRTLRAFGENLGSSEYTLKKKTIHGKEIYILNYDRGSSTKLDDLQRRVYATIIQNIHDGSYSTYSYSTMKKFKYHIHFSSEEDVLENKEYYEVKTLHETKYPDHRPPPNMAYHIAIQCLSRQSKKVLIGFYNETHVILKLFTLEKLIRIAKEGKKNVQSAENMMNYNLEQIIDYIKRNGSNMLHKTVIIKKADNKNRLNFFVEK